MREAETRLESAEGMKRRGSILDTLTKLKQACNHPRQLLGDNSVIAGRSGKLARLQEILDEVLPAGDRVLLFSQFAEMGAILQQHVQETYGLETSFLHGGVTRKQRDRMVQRFQDDPDGPQVFVLSLKAGGSGLNLPRANHVVHYDRWWNPAVENQATDRAFRIGQTRDVHVHKLICAGTLEDRIDLMIEIKQETADQVVASTSERWLTELSNAELPRRAGPQLKPGGVGTRGSDGRQPGLLPHTGKTMSYHDPIYTRPIEVRGGIKGRVETGRLRLQLVGQAVAPDP